VAGRVGEDPEALAAGVHAGRAQLQRPGLAGVEIVDNEVEVGLLRARRVRPAGRVVAGSS
jgi:hypothetical protein